MAVTNLARLVTVLETNTVQFDAGFQRATRTLGTFGRSSTDMSRGVGMAKSAIQTLAFQAAGVEGPVGKLGSSLLMFGVGGVYTAAFLAGFVAMRKAMEFFQRDAVATAARVGEFNFDVQRRMWTPLQDATLGVVTARTNLAAAQAGQKGAGTVEDATTSLRFWLGEQNKLVAEQAKSLREAAEWAQQLARTMALLVGSSGFGPASSPLQFIGAPVFGAGGMGIPKGMVRAGAGFLADTAGVAGAPSLRVPANLASAMRPDMLDAFHRTGVPLGPTGGRRFGVSGQDAATAGIFALQGALAGGGIGSLLGGGLGLAGTAIGGPIGGAVGSFIGGQLGKLFGGGPSAQELMLQELRRANETLQQQLKIAEDTKNFRGVVVVRARGFDPTDPDDVDRLIDIVRGADDRRVELTFDRDGAA